MVKEISNLFIYGISSSACNGFSFFPIFLLVCFHAVDSIPTVFFTRHPLDVDVAFVCVCVRFPLVFIS